ncbi:MAG: hypothetical protein ACXVYB_00040 [Arthrobacter sp.]
METGSQSGAAPVAATGDIDVLDVVEDEGFERIYDVPFITVNIIDGKMVGEVECSVSQLETLSRIQEAEDAARQKGWHLFGRKHGDREYPELTGITHGWIQLYFTPDLDGGL